MGAIVRFIVRSIGVVALAVLSAVLLALTTTSTTVYVLAASTYAVPGLLGYPFGQQPTVDLATPYLTGAVGEPPMEPIEVVSLSQLPSPDTIESGSVIFGISQGSMDATTYKSGFNQYWADNGGTPPNVTYVLLGNPGRANGGSASRVNIGTTPNETPGVDGITTYDIARQYDPVADAPLNPTNLLAVANESMGFLLLHVYYQGADMSQAILQDTYGDTKYYLIPTYPLPLLVPLDMIPGFGHALADMLDPPLRVLIEAAYDRTISPGQPTQQDFSYYPDPDVLSENFQIAVSTGMDNMSENMGEGRPLGTVRPGPYGVGGPPVAVDAATDQQVLTSAEAPVQPGSELSQPGTDTIASTTEVVASTTEVASDPTTNVTASTHPKRPRLTNRGLPESDVTNRLSQDGPVRKALDHLTSRLGTKPEKPADSEPAPADNSSEN